jgi:hypothetical protein
MTLRPIRMANLGLRGLRGLVHQQKVGVQRAPRQPRPPGDGQRGEDHPRRPQHLPLHLRAPGGWC